MHAHTHAACHQPRAPCAPPCPRAQSDPHLTQRDLMDIQYLGRTLLERVDQPVSHKVGAGIELGPSVMTY